MKIIMIDAFKPEYLEHAPYLASLTKKFQWGELQMPPGHEGGMEIFFRGQSDKIALFFKKDNSSLRFVKYLTFLDNFGKAGRFIIDCLINLPRAIRGYELFRTGNIPLKKLHNFEFSINKPFYKIHGIEYCYMGDLDRIGHKYGTKSKEMIIAIKKVDRKVSKMNFDIILSDHGMTDIKKEISVPRSKNCFIDSDMARYWGNEEELKEIKKNLSLREGKILDWKYKNFGELIFIVHAGTLISQNFWQGKIPVKAMHGYLGKEKDMKAFYVIKREGKKKNLKVEELHKIFVEMKNGK
ncbi:alkaline phosphatase family protein [Candidatus Pacearchaeota archaeon]|jgi:hypothetical protein|nr:alkaline phosphatase family protein [Candidatus Pacearchaeota archaeon]